MNEANGGLGLILDCELTCPHCGHKSVEEMPVNARQYFHQCAGCGTRLTPKPGDCCVYCSYGSYPCPPIQQQGGACCSGD